MTRDEILKKIREAKRSEQTELVFSFDEIGEVPPEIGQLTSLKSLSLYGNQLASLPETIGQLTSLETLDLRNNQLTTLPETIGKLTSLKSLYLQGNQLASLPPSLANLSSLLELDLDKNDGLGIPPDVLESRADPAKLLDYYFRVQRGQKPLNEAKLVLVGRGGVGKTSLVNRLVDDRFDPREEKTEGIKITKWPLRLPGNEEVRLNIWDFGGQEIMHATHQFFLTHRSLYLLVLNGREGGEDADAEYWLRLIESFAGDSPVIVVLNKFKQHPFALNRRGLQQKFPAIRDFVQTDCAKPLGIEKLRRTIERETDRLKHLRDAFPAAWFSIKGSRVRVLPGTPIKSRGYAKPLDPGEIVSHQ